jgi:site-specific DNA recombinase
MKRCFAYIRVSTARQGEQGSSLQEQRSAIESYARKNNLTITRWYEEIETAAKLGRRVFGRMLSDIKRHDVNGIVIHKIDRSARNLKDWAAVGELSDSGVEVHFAHESLDLRSRGGRLAADVQAVVAADYIRNLRDEVKKGFYGRLKQGFYPLPAPLGYIDKGAGVAKEIDPVRGPLIREAFVLYASGDFSFVSLPAELAKRGLRNRRGRIIPRNSIATILHNPFYAGLIRIRRTGELFEGNHTRLISKALFDDVQRRSSAKTNLRGRSHDFLLRRLLRCASCGATLVGELQKEKVYYRCHTRACAGSSIREDDYLLAARQVLTALCFDENDFGDLRDELHSFREEWLTSAEARNQQIRHSLLVCDDRLAKLTDAYVDGLIERNLFDLRKASLFDEKLHLKTQLERSQNGRSVPDTLQAILERAQTALFMFESGIASEKRELLRSLTSNLRLDQKTPVITLRPVYKAISEVAENRCGGPSRAMYRTAIDRLIGLLSHQDDSTLEAVSSRTTPQSPHLH